MCFVFLFVVITSCNKIVWFRQERKFCGKDQSFKKHLELYLFVGLYYKGSGILWEGEHTLPWRAEWS